MTTRAARTTAKRNGRSDGAAHAPTHLVLARHAVTAQTGPLLSGRAPGIDLSEEGRNQAEALGARLAALPVAAVYASPIERTTQTAQAVAAHHGLPVLPLDGVLEADYGEWTGQKLVDLAKTDLWKVVQRSAVARVVPRRGGARGDAGPHGRGARGRGRSTIPRRARGGGVARRSDQGRDRALHRRPPRPVPADLVSPASVTAFAFSAARGRHAEVQRHRRRSTSCGHRPRPSAPQAPKQPSQDGRAAEEQAE